jgi:hypothetical protein
MNRMRIEAPEEITLPTGNREKALYQKARVSTDSAMIIMDIGVLHFGDATDIALFMDLLGSMYGAKREFEQRAMVREVDGGGPAADAVRPAAEGSH